GPAHHRVDEDAGALAGDELLIDALLAEPHVEPAVEEALLIPELPEARRPAGLDAARRLQRREVVGTEVAAVDLQAADVEEPAVEAKGTLRVELQRPRRKPVILEASRAAAGDVAEDLALLLQGRRQTVIADGAAQTAHIAEQVFPPPQPGKEWRPLIGGGRWRSGLG